MNLGLALLAMPTPAALGYRLRLAGRWGVAVVVLTLTSTALAQPAPVPPPAPGRPTAAPVPAKPAEPQRPPLPGAKPPPVGTAKPKVPKGPQEREELRAKARQKIRALRAQKLAEVLRPDATPLPKVLEIAEQYEDKVIAARTDLRTRRKELDTLLAAVPLSEPAIAKATDAVLAHRARLQQIDEERISALRKVLSPSQFARVMLAWPRINRQIQEQIYRAIFKNRDAAAQSDEDL